MLISFAETASSRSSSVMTSSPKGNFQRSACQQSSRCVREKPAFSMAERRCVPSVYAVCSDLLFFGMR